MSHRVDDLLAHQRRSWQQGNARPVEAYLSEHPLLAEDEEGTVDLIYQEFLLRSELGPAPSLEEYARRFPRLRSQLEAQLAFLRVVQEVAGDGGVGDPHRTLGDSYQAPDDDLPDDVDADWPRLDGYDILGELGRGAMGIVYQARQHILGRLVALKMLHPGTAGSPQSRKRFRREAQQLARLRHPNIVQVYEVGEQHGRPYFAMELVEGSSLAERPAGVPLPDDQAARLVETLARAIHHAHQRGIVHRDLKPANVLLQKVTSSQQSVVSRKPEAASSSTGYGLLTTDFSPKISDFGLAKQLDAAGQSQSGMIVGTPSYMAPEQAEPGDGVAHPAVDVYALGAILYELVTGRPPFQGATPLQVLEEVRRRQPVPPSRWNPGVARDLETICLKCLHKEPARRYASADALAEDLRRFGRGEPIEARPVGLLERGWLWCRRRPVPAGLLAALLLALAGSLYLWHQADAGQRLAVAAHQQTDAARRLADEHVHVLLQLMTTNLEVSGSSFLRKEGGDSISRELLDRAAAACAHLEGPLGNDPELQRLQALVWTKQACLRQRGWQYDKALDLLGRALRLWDGLPAAVARRPENRWGRACTLWELGTTYGKLDASPEAVRALEQAHELCRGLGTDDPSSPVRVIGAAAGLLMIHHLHHLGRSEEARQKFDRLRPTLVPLLQQPAPDAQVLMGLALLCQQFARGPSDPLFAEAVERREQAYQAFRERVQADQNDTEPRSYLAANASALITLHHQAGRPAAALEVWQRHLQFREALLRVHPGMLKDDVEVLQDLCELMSLHEGARQHGAVLTTARRAAAVLVACPDAVVRDWSQSHCVYTDLAGVFRRHGAPAEALRVSEQYVERIERFTRREPVNDHFRSLLSNAWHWLSKAHWNLGQHEASLAALRQAVAVQRDVLARQPASASHRDQLGELHLRLARKLCELDRLEEAKDCLRQRQQLWPHDAEKLRKAGHDLERWARAEPPDRQAQRRRYLDLGAWVMGEAEALAAGG